MFFLLLTTILNLSWQTFTDPAAPARGIASTPGSCAPVENLWLKAGFAEPADQEETQWCFAHSVANLLSVKTGRAFDARRLALDFHASESRLPQKTSYVEGVGGFLTNTAKLAFVKGVCLAGPATGENCVRHQLRGGQVRGGAVGNRDKMLVSIDRALEAGEPVAIAIDLSFFRPADADAFHHAVTLVGREAGEGGCVYVAVDSNRNRFRWKKEYFRRLDQGTLRLTADEIRAHTTAVQMVTGPVSLN